MVTAWQRLNSHYRQDSARRAEYAESDREEVGLLAEKRPLRLTTSAQFFGVCKSLPNCAVNDEGGQK